MKNVQLKREMPVFPYHHRTQTTNIRPIASTPLFEPFRMGNKQFAEFCNAAQFELLKPYLIEVDIQDECQHMTEDSFLEITVPVLGLHDLMDEVEFFNPSVLNPSFVALNGFGAKGSDQNSFPQVDYIKVLDIADNRYEIMRNINGTLELPEQGMGLFTIIKELTYILGFRQVIRGDGLENIESAGAKKGKLYLLPPIHSDESFKFHVCLTHISENNRRIVDSIRAIDVNYLNVPMEWEPKRTALREISENGLKSVDLSIRLIGSFSLSRPVMINIRIEPEASASYEPTNLNGWTQHPVLSNVFSKRFGLSQIALMHLIEDLYTEFDFMRDYLTKNPIPLSRDNDYNNFLLRPEVFSRIYKSLIHDWANGYIPRDILLSRIHPDRLLEIDISHYSVDFHDSVVLAQIQEEFSEGKIGTFSRLLYPNVPCFEIRIQDEFYLNVECSKDFIPDVQVEVLVVSEPELDIEPVISNFIEDRDPMLIEEAPVNLSREILNAHSLHLSQVTDIPFMAVPTPGIGTKDPEASIGGAVDSNSKDKKGNKPY